MAVRRHPWRWAGGLALAVALLAGWWLWSNSQRYLKQGTDLLNFGRYADARPALEQAKKFNPLSKAAGCGLTAVKLDAMRSDPEQLRTRLDEASREYPGCAYLKVLSGEQKARAGNFPAAIKDFTSAKDSEPKLAEAHFDMGLAYDAQGDPDSALEPYQTACNLSPDTPRYCDNLADLYFRQGKYPEAIKVYGKTEQHPNSFLELAKIYRLQGKLPEAAGREKDAIRWLEKPSAPAEQENVWVLDTGVDHTVQLSSLNEKQCYAKLELAVTRFLQGDKSEAARVVPATLGESGKCDSRKTELTNILRWELRRMRNEVPQLAQGSEGFAKLLGVSLDY